MTQAEDIATVIKVCGMTAETLARLLVSSCSPRAALASVLEAHAATAATAGEHQKTERLIELARRLRS